MALRIHLVFAYIALCLLPLYSANPFMSAKLEKILPRIVGFSWNDCGPAGDPAHVSALTVTPDPIKIPGNITIDTTFTLSTSGPTDIALSIVMEKKVAGFYIKIPCVDNVGSCTYGDVCKDWADECPKYFSKYGIPCTCPIPANTYSVPDASVDVTSKLPPGATGDLRITANLVSQTAGHIICLQLEVNLAN